MSSQPHSRNFRSEDAISGTFSALHFLRNYSLLAPPPELCRYDPYHPIDFGVDADVIQSNINKEAPSSPLVPSSMSTTFSLPTGLLQPSLITTIPPFMQSVNIPQPCVNSTSDALMNRHLISTGVTSFQQRKPRSEKKAIPDEQKDDKYFERRKRNNQAAKKSRDARKIREDHIALRATMLEHENAILRAQIVSLREETQSLRHILMKQQTSSLQSMDRSRSISEIGPISLSNARSVTSLVV
ncbi:hepatic leukemia factor [Leptopilina boulardi]|uniref:hepatic leukemia factor n=1 Tax=Leptopilina boulardi TaxID=63433 RepID=UPI0021F5A4F3|nr:hepatic leukemia factor [Leptopilina boulardi]